MRCKIKLRVACECRNNVMISHLYSFFKSLREEFIAIFNSNAILP